MQAGFLLIKMPKCLSTKCLSSKWLTIKCLHTKMSVVQMVFYQKTLNLLARDHLWKKKNLFFKKMKWDKKKFYNSTFSPFCYNFWHHIMTLLMKTSLIIAILITLNKGYITSNDITYNWPYSSMTLHTYNSKLKTFMLCHIY